MNQRNIKLTLMYDGTDYHGFQIQKNGVTVQQCLQDAIKAVTGEECNVIGCGRTDAGVHAINYTANFKTCCRIPSDKIHFALNAHLNNDIRVLKAEDAEDDFHSRYSAVKKTYTYKILNKSVGDVFLSRYSWFFPGKLDTSLMKAAIPHFIGEHDFAAFMAAGSPVSSTVRNIYDLTLTEQDGVIDIHITANGFLYNMVRIITGTLVYVGCRKISAEDIPCIIKSCDRTKAGITAPPQGLSLEKVYYTEG